MSIIQDFSDLFDRIFNSDSSNRSYKQATDTGEDLHEEFFENALCALEKGDISQTDSAYSGIKTYGCKNSNFLKRLGTAVTSAVENMSCTQMIRLSENYRMYSSYEWYSDWNEFDVSDLKKEFSSEQDYISILMIGSINPNGYYREKCVDLMSEYKSALPFMILRMNDWIENIRISAFAYACKTCEKCTVTELAQLMPFISKVQHSLRRDADNTDFLYRKITDLIKKNITEKDIFEIILIKDFSVKKYAYKMLLAGDILTKKSVRLIRSTEKNKFLKSYVTCKYIELYDPDDEELDEMLCDRSYMVRYTAVLYKYKRVGDVWEGAQKLLLDKRCSIREFMIFIYKKHTDVDIRKFYEDNLTGPYCSQAIHGIGECGTKDDAVIIMPFLESSNDRTVISSLKAIRYLTGDKASEIYWRFLFHRSISVSKTAYQMIRKSRSQYGAERVYNAISECSSRSDQNAADNERNIKKSRYLVTILTYEDSWDRLPYLLLLYQYGDQKLKWLIRNAVTTRSPYAKISGKQAEFIRSVMKKQHDILPSGLIWELEHDLKNLVR